MSHYPTRSSKARKRPLIQSLVLEVVIIKEFESLMTGQKSKGPSVQPFHYHLYSSAGALYPNLCFCTKLASGFEPRNFMPWGSGTNLYTTILPKKSKLFFFFFKSFLSFNLAIHRETISSLIRTSVSNNGSLKWTIKLMSNSLFLFLDSSESRALMTKKHF